MKLSKHSRNEATIRRYVERHGGVYCGEFNWPLSGEDLEKYFAFRAPKGHMKHQCEVQFKEGKKCFLYSLPDYRLPSRSKPSKEVTPTPEYETAQ